MQRAPLKRGDRHSLRAKKHKGRAKFNNLGTRSYQQTQASKLKGKMALV